MKKLLFVGLLLVAFNTFSQTNIILSQKKPYFQGNVKVKDTLGVENILLVDTIKGFSSSTIIIADTVSFSIGMNAARINVDTLGISANTKQIYLDSASFIKFVEFLNNIKADSVKANHFGGQSDFTIGKQGEKVTIGVDTLIISGNVGIGTNISDELTHIAKAVDGVSVGLLIENSQANSASSTNETAELRFGFGGINDVASITTKKIKDYTSSANEDASLHFSIDIDGVLSEIFHLRSTGIRFDSAADRVSFFGTPGGSGGIFYKDLGGGSRSALLFPGSDVVSITNRASTGAVEVRANTSTAGNGGEVTVATFEDDTISFLVSSGNVGFGVSDPDEQLEMTGRIHLGQTTAPATTTDKLYNVSGDLTWNSNIVTTSGYMLQGIFEADSWTTTGRKVTLSTVVVAAGDQGVWTNFEAKEYDPGTWRSGDTLIVPAGAEGFYQLNFYAFHSNSDMRGASSQDLLGEFRVGYKLGTQDAMYGSGDPFTGMPDAATVTTPVYLVAGDKILFIIDISGTEATSQDVAIGISIIRMSGAF